MSASTKPLALPIPFSAFIKLEDTVAVTAAGHESYSEGARDWNRAARRFGASPRSRPPLRVILHGFGTLALVSFACDRFRIGVP
jgi:hypothetical protein